MKSKIESTFEKCKENLCIESNDEKEFYVIDDQIKKRCIVYKGEKNKLKHPYILVNNPSENEINLLAIDNCIFDHSEGEKCDCALFDHKSFHIVEIKKSADPQRRNVQKIKAIKQLLATYEKLKSLDFSGYQKFAHICVGYFRTYPGSLSSYSSYRIKFKTEFNADLIEGNVVEF